MESGWNPGLYPDVAHKGFVGVGGFIQQDIQIGRGEGTL